MLRGVIFDLDGTLIDSQYDWKLIRKQIGVENLPILSHINNLKGALRKRATGILESFERIATQRARLNRGMKRLLQVIAAKGMKKALVTNNSRRTVDYLIEKLDLSFDYIVTRDDGVWKPSGKPLQMAVEKLRMEKDEVLYIGNSEHDRIAAADAGIKYISISDPDGMEAVFSFFEENS